MKKLLTLTIISTLVAAGCNQPETEQAIAGNKEEFTWQTEQFADLRILRYQIPDFEKISLRNKKLVYYLTQAGLSGRDIIYDQNYRYNLEIRKALENIVKNYNGDKNSEEWTQLLTYTKRIWFSNGIHHHYSNLKFKPEFTREYLNKMLNDTNTLLSDTIITILFDPTRDAKKVNKDPNEDLLLASAVNFYDSDITEKEVDNFYKKMTDSKDPHPVSYGLNSKIVRNKDGSLEEMVWHANGMYGDAIRKIIFWLEKAAEVAENVQQADALRLLIQYYKTGDLKVWDQYNIAWVEVTKGDIDYINSFIEVYNDPIGIKGSYESIVQIRDFEASERMKTLSDNVQWFEDHSPIMDEHKKSNVVGVTYKIVNIAGESGDASPSTPIGVNLPNANWIRVEHGSKSVSLGNIEEAYHKATGEEFLKEFAYNQEELERAKKFSDVADKLHTALHEVVGHASGKINPGVGTPKETLKNYASTLEEGRADLVALYFMMDPHMIDLGLIESLEVGKAAYDEYILNGLMLQLRRLNPGEIIEEDHMRNRQMIAMWALDAGKENKVIEKKVKDGKTYFVINDYEKLRNIFGMQLREIQRIKSEGDYQAGHDLVEKYGVQVDSDLHREVLKRSEKLHIAPYAGFINPKLVPEMDGDSIKDIRVEYPQDFTQQMLEYGDIYSFLKPTEEIANLK